MTGPAPPASSGFRDLYQVVKPCWGLPMVRPPDPPERGRYSRTFPPKRPSTLRAILKTYRILWVISLVIINQSLCSIITKNTNTSDAYLMEPYIVGGKIATIEQFPHAVYMFLTCVGESWICGGSILTQDLVLSAAHCFKRCSQDLDVNVYVGSAIVYQMPVSRYVSTYILHRTYDASSSRDDIALARTKENMPLGKTIRRVAIEKAFPRVTRAQVAGWGLSDDAQLVEKGQLQWLSQWIIGGRLCNKFHLEPGMICVENTISNRPSHGDSGCALMANNVQQIGLVSFRHPEIINLIVYSNVSYYYNWIQRSARQLSCTNE